jgi:ubiquitin-protein ligase
MQSEKSNIKVSILDGDFRHCKGYITGPEDTIYQGGVYQIDIQLPP